MTVAQHQKWLRMKPILKQARRTLLAWHAVKAERRCQRRRRTLDAQEVFAKVDALNDDNYHLVMRIVRPFNKSSDVDDESVYINCATALKISGAVSLLLQGQSMGEKAAASEVKVKLEPQADDDKV